MVDDFPNWLNPETLKPIDSPHTTALTTIWTDCFGYTFVHDFHRGVSMDEELPTVKAKYRRRIDRMKRLIGASSQVLLVCVEMPGFPTVAEGHPNEVRRILRTKWPDVQFDFLIIRNCEDGAVADEDRGHIIPLRMRHRRRKISRLAARHVPVPADERPPCGRCRRQRVHCAGILGRPELHRLRRLLASVDRYRARSADRNLVADLPVVPKPGERVGLVVGIRQLELGRRRRS